MVPSCSYQARSRRSSPSRGRLRSAALSTTASGPIPEGYQAGDQLTWVHGAHTIKMGGDVETTKSALCRSGNHARNDRVFHFPGFPAGPERRTERQRIQQFVQRAEPLRRRRKEFQGNRFDFYFQDDIHVTRNLTVNLGLRWDIYGQISDDKGKFAAFWPQLATNTFPASGNLYTGFIVPANYVLQLRSGRPTGVAMNSNNTSPEIRSLIATSVHASASVGTRGPSWWSAAVTASIMPARRQTTHTNLSAIRLSRSRNRTRPRSPPPATFQNPWPPSAPPLASNYPAFLPRTQTSQLTLNLPGPVFTPPTVQQFSINVQYELTHSTMLQVGYVGTKSTHLEGTQNINQALLTVNPDSSLAPTFTGPTTAAANINARRPYLGFSTHQPGAGDLHRATTTVFRRSFSVG